jgi:hypothetical protein
MASRPLLTAEAAHARHTAERQKAAEVAERFPGWHVWSARKGITRLATRTGNRTPPEPLGDWAQTVMADDWADLEQQLAEQAQCDAERTYDIAG